MPPVIGLTAQPKLAPSAAGQIRSHALAHTYTDAVLRAGGTPLLLLPVPTPQIPSLLDRLDGLVLTGGGDVDPTRYDTDAVPTVREIDSDRDGFEIELVRAAMAIRKPTLAICRGQQVLNVALGGTLIQDIPMAVGTTDHDQIGEHVYDAHQAVKIEPDSVVATVVGDTELMVNSVHHQAIEELAPGLAAVAWAGDGVIEAVQHEDDRWPLISVQWHPEYLDHRGDDASSRLFAALVAAAG